MSEQCRLLRELSRDTWNRINFSRSRLGLKIYEVTITQNLIYEINRHNSKSMISIFEAIDENTNGNDIELYIQTKDGYLFFPIQSKIVYKNQAYPKMEHGNQIHELINYAAVRGGVPLYLLYNFSPDFLFSGDIRGISCSSSDFGCTLIDAKYLLNNFAFKRTDKNGNKRWNIPTFHDLHPNQAIPWFIPFCIEKAEADKKRVFEKAFPTFNTDQLSNMKTYSMSDIEESKGWIPLDISKPGYEEVESVKIESKPKKYDGIIEGDSQNDIKFSPKFRLVFRNSD